MTKWKHPLTHLGCTVCGVLTMMAASAWAETPDGQVLSIEVRSAGYNGTTSEKANALYQSGYQAFQAEDWKSAQRFWKKAVKADDTFVEAYDMLGTASRRLGQIDEALTAYQRSYALFPDGPMALANIGMIQGFQKKFDAAEKTYLEYVERHPNDPEGPFGLSSVYLNNKRPGDALQQAQAAVSLYKAAKSPYWVHAEFNIGLAYATMGQHKAAVPHLITARDNGVALPPQLAAIVDTGGVPKPISSSNSCDPAVFQTVHGPSSYPDYDALVLQCVDWFSSQRWVSPAKNKPLSRHQISSMWLMKEMTNHPTVHIVINNHFWVPGQAEPELLVVFMLGWFKYAIENNIAENKPEANPELMAALNAAGVRFVLAYQQRHGYTQTMTFQTYAEAEKEGRLDTWFGDIAKKIAAKANP